MPPPKKKNDSNGIYSPSKKNRPWAIKKTPWCAANLASFRWVSHVIEHVMTTCTTGTPHTHHTRESDQGIMFKLQNLMFRGPSWIFLLPHLDSFRTYMLGAWFHGFCAATFSCFFPCFFSSMTPHFLWVDTPFVTEVPTLASEVMLQI